MTIERFEWISHSDSKLNSLLNSENIISKDIQKLRSSENNYRFSYVIEKSSTSEKVLNRIKEIELEPQSIYVLHVLDNVAEMKALILVHLATMYPFIENLISYVFDDGTMFVPLDESGNRIYTNINYPDYQKYIGMTAIVDKSNLSRYSLGLKKYGDYVKIDNIYLIKDPKKEKKYLT